MHILDRRDFLRAVAGGALAFAAPKAHGQTSARRPNVIIILSDDQGTLDINNYGSKDLHTPNLDALAARGVKFTQFYDAAPVCSPSRGALLTGRYPQNNGVENNSQPLREGETTIAEMLKGAGYRTGQFGKWHIGHSQPTEPYGGDSASLPNAEGFDYSFGFLGGCIDKWSHFNYGGASWGAPPHWHDLHRNGEEVHYAGRHSGDLAVDEAIQFIERDDPAPFFVYLAFGTPHYPMHPYDKYVEHYKDLPEPRRLYAALVSTMDEQLGRLVDAVDRNDLREDTLIIFLSDHGHSTEARANYGGGNAGPYRGAKFSLFEGGIRVPAIASMPGVLPEGGKREQMAMSIDWLPTIAGLTGAELPGRPLDGHDLMPVFQNASAPTSHDVTHWMLKDQWAVRQGDWKLLVNANDTTDGRNVFTLDEPFLANLLRDPSEQTNFAAEHPEKVQELTELHETWLASIEKPS